MSDHNLQRTLSCPEQVGEVDENEEAYQQLRACDDNYTMFSEENGDTENVQIGDNISDSKTNTLIGNKKSKRTKRDYIKKEFVKVMDRFRVKATKFKPSSENLIVVPSTYEDSHIIKRKLRVESSYHQYSRKKAQSQDSVLNNVDNTEFIYRDYTQVLQIMPLKDFKFQAIFDLKILPPIGDLTVYVGDNKISLYLSTNNTRKKKCIHVKNLGYLTLPMYIDPSTIELEIQENSMLLIEATLKGLLARRMSMSSENLSDRSKIRKIKTPQIRKKVNFSSEWDINTVEN